MPGDPLLNAVLEPHRRTLLQLLADGPQPVGALAKHFPVSRPAISQHLAVLKDAGLVELDATTRAYRLRPAGVTAALSRLEALGSELPGAPPATPATATPASAPGPAAVPAEVAVELDVAAPPAALFAAFTVPDGLTAWLGEQAELDPRPGGTFRLALGGGDVARGEYVEVESPVRVAFTWGQEGDAGPPPHLGPGSSRVDVTLTPRGDGTHVRLEHRDLPPDARAPHLTAWGRHLGTLAAALGG